MAAKKISQREARRPRSLGGILFSVYVPSSATLSLFVIPKEKR